MNDARLHGVSGLVTGQSFKVNPTGLTIGRSPDTDISIPTDASVSRNHAKVYAQGDVLFVTDLGSSNGTRVNGKPIAGPTALSEGDQIEVGGQTLKVSIPIASVASPAKDRTNPLLGCVAFVILASLIGWGANSILKPRPSSAEVSAQAIHKWFQENLNDADSVQVVSIYDAPADQQVPGAQALFVSYRAKNGFGAYRLVRDELMVIRDGRVVKAESPEDRARRIQGEQIDKVYDQMHGGSGQ